MLFKRRCPHTGVVNFYSAEDPHMAVGSVVLDSSGGDSAVGQSGNFYWRFYTEPYARGGLAHDINSAEREVVAAGLFAKRALQNTPSTAA